MNPHPPTPHPRVLLMKSFLMKQARCCRCAQVETDMRDRSILHGRRASWSKKKRQQRVSRLFAQRACCVEGWGWSANYVWEEGEREHSIYILACIKRAREVIYARPSRRRTNKTPAPTTGANIWRPDKYDRVLLNWIVTYLVLSTKLQQGFSFNQFYDKYQSNRLFSLVVKICETKNIRENA